MPDGPQEHLPDPLLNPPEVGRLAHEGGATHLGHCWKEMAVMLSEVAVEGEVLAEAQESPHGFDGQHFSIGQRRLRPAPAEPFPPQKTLQGIIYPAKNCYYLGVQVHHTPPPGLSYL